MLAHVWNYCLTTPVWLLYDVVLAKNNRRIEGGEMKNPLDSLWGTVISGLVITVILYNVIKFALQ